MMEEAVWLVEQGVAAIVSGTGEGVAERLSGVRAEQWAEWERGAALERGAQLAWKREQLAQKKPERAVTERDEALMQQSVFVHTRDTPRAVPSGVPRDAESTAESPGSAAIDVTALLKRDNRLRANYGVYRSLRAKGYVLSPGARFGGRYVAYPGDPLRYHSHLIVQEAMDKKQEIDLLSMVNGARLGTSVKKTWVLAGVGAEKEEAGAEAEPETEFYSVEWAGFG
ncbi:tRNA-splicing endonuclease subunit SEN34 [Kluyveromyces marxianus DMKU3-1042]|uniref:tRNA-splicing endonuclease subunit SEN34 n=1 Tax=Kluyveromyces marxianus (strain DMKU3-1042 / BCC 29191 / NBRC 104275) TaxID=1003335 RepID=W0T4U3_KLUMD|nr:tRNA-splicing endonuclease subunit SEN34 [Kluyveromyces marxianus DMKU3-1042]BAO38078.1 tRNA-splicing endonuclease subunit SEN34 [Kluyveromyces marxianus DMKU3-1042]